MESPSDEISGVVISVVKELSTFRHCYTEVIDGAINYCLRKKGVRSIADSDREYIRATVVDILNGR